MGFVNQKPVVKEILNLKPKAILIINKIIN